jgi:sulfite exporter TauE/SafE
MVVVSLSLLGVLPPLEVALVKLSAGSSPMSRMRELFGKRNVLASVTLGILWGFLPCGLVFAMLVLAARAGTLPGGALTMLAFGLGTIPTLLGFGLAANLLSPQLRGRLTSVAAVLLMLFAVQTILRGLAVANVIPSLSIGQVMLW